MNPEERAQVGRLLRKVVRRLKAAYVFDRLGNLDDPLDELVYIVLSTRTRGEVFERTFARMRQRFPTWEMASRARYSTLEKLLEPAGLSRKKAKWLKDLLREIRIREGEVSLGCLREMSTQEAETYLTSLPGVGPKTARCVLMYSLGREVFPVDANVRRLLERLEVLPRRVHYYYVHDVAQEMVPRNIRADLHIYSIIHGRLTCQPRTPRCESCVLADLCPYPGRIEPTSSQEANASKSSPVV